MHVGLFLSLYVYAIVVNRQAPYLVGDAPNRIGYTDIIAVSCRRGSQRVVDEDRSGLSMRVDEGSRRVVDEDRGELSTRVAVIFEPPRTTCR